MMHAMPLSDLYQSGPNYRPEPVILCNLYFLCPALFRLGKYQLKYYNYPQKLDSAIRCMIACKSSKEARRNAQSAEAT